MELKTESAIAADVRLFVETFADLETVVLSGKRFGVATPGVEGSNRIYFIDATGAPIPRVWFQGKILGGAATTSLRAHSDSDGR